MFKYIREQIISMIKKRFLVTLGVKKGGIVQLTGDNDRVEKQGMGSRGWGAGNRPGAGSWEHEGGEGIPAGCRELRAKEQEMWIMERGTGNEEPKAGSQVWGAKYRKLESGGVMANDLTVGAP